MPQHVSYTCSDCAERIEDQPCPVVVYIVAGIVPMHPLAPRAHETTEVTNFPLPAIVRELLAQPVARMDFCADCFAKKIGHPLVDAEGKSV